MEKFCSVASKKISPGECGTFDGCGDPAKCKLRQYYGFDAYPPATKKPEPKPEPEPSREAGPAESSRECNMCHKLLDAVNFRMRQDRKGRKKTCADCEDRYVTKTKPAPASSKRGRPAKAKKPSAKKPQAKPDTSQENAPEKQQIDLSEFEWIENTWRRSNGPSVFVGKRDITFNASARREYAALFSSCQTVDVGLKKNGSGLQILFRLREDMTGHYRLQTGGRTKEQYRVCVSLDTRGYKIERGPWSVREVDGMLLAEVG